MRTIVKCILLLVASLFFNELHAQIRAKTFPMGTIKRESFINKDSKVYRIETPVFSENTEVEITERKYSSNSKKTKEKNILTQHYKKGESCSFELIFNENNQKGTELFISFPGFFIGALNLEILEKDKIEHSLIKIEESETEENKKVPTIIFYNNNTSTDFKSKIGSKNFLIEGENELNDTEDDSYYLIYYKYRKI